MNVIVTASTIATMTSEATTSMAEALSLIATFAFVAFLIGKQIVVSNADRRLMLLSRGLNIGTVPLGLALLVIMAAALFNFFG